MAAVRAFGARSARPTYDIESEVEPGHAGAVGRVASVLVRVITLNAVDVESVSLNLEPETRNTNTVLQQSQNNNNLYFVLEVHRRYRRCSRLNFEVHAFGYL